MTLPTFAKLLALDTSTEAMAVAVHNGVNVFALDAPGGAQASATLLPSIQDLMSRAGLRFEDLDAIAYGCGPGAFTGLRTACSVTQGLACGANKPVIAVDSLWLVAEDALEGFGVASRFQVDVAMDARMGEAYAAAYVHEHGLWQVLRQPELTTPQALLAVWQQQVPEHLAGTAFEALADAFGELPWPKQPHSRSRARSLMRCAQAQWRNGALLDAAQALPLYLRDKVAQTTAEREATKLAKGPR